jgi:hypothetical protein
MMTDTQSVDLKVTVNDKAAGALESLASSIEKVTKAEKQIIAETQRLAKEQASLNNQKDEYRKKLRDEAEARKKKPTVGDRVESVARGAQGLVGGGGLAGLIGKGGAWGAAIQAGVGAIEAGMQRGANAANIANSGVLTGAQKSEMLMAEFVPLYGSLKKFREAIDGTTERVAESNRKLQRTLVAQAANAAGYAQKRTFEFPAVEGFATARASRTRGRYPN